MAAEAPGIDALPARIRHRFPIFGRRVYINSCSQGALSDSVRAAYDRYLADWDEHGAPWEYWVGQHEAARRSIAGLIGAGEDEVAVTTSVSAGLSAVASGLRFDRGRSKVLVSDFEFPTVGQIWHAQELRGAVVEHVPAEPDGTIPLERFEAVIDEQTALVAVTHVCFRNGSRIDVKGVAEIAHERGALVFLDGYQAVGSLPVEVHELDCDFLAAGVLKYLLGSAGLGFFYCRAELVPTLWPTQTGWFADQNIFEMDIHDYSPSPTARRFESGTPPIPSIYAGVAGIELMQEIGIEETRLHVLGLHDRLYDGVAELGGTIVTPADPEKRGALVCVRSTAVDELVRRLAADSIVTSSRDGNLRISPHCYNTAEDVDAVLAALAKSRELLG